jgi:hypothetical protein
MKVTVKLALALVASLGLLAVGTSGWAAEAKHSNSEKVAKILKPAQEALQKKQYADALGKIREAQALSDKTPFDQYTIHEFACQANIGAGNYAEAAKECEARLDDQFMPEADKAQMIKLLLALNYQLKNYDKAIDYGQRAVKGGFATEENKNFLAQAYYLKGDWKNSLKMEEALVDADIKGGQTPKEPQLSLVLSSCVKLEDKACQQHALERMVAYYPKPEHWKNLLFSVQQQSSGNDANTLQTFRLMSDVDVLETPSDYNEMAQLALEAGSPGEAQKVLEKGFAANVFNEQRAKDRNTRLLETVKKNVASDQAALPKTEKEAENFGVGLAYYGYGQYDKAADQISKGLTKGGLRNDAEARLLLGIAQLKGGHKDEAVKSFKAVKDPNNPTLEQLANLWALHARQA